MTTLFQNVIGKHFKVKGCMERTIYKNKSHKYGESLSVRAKGIEKTKSSALRTCYIKTQTGVIQ
jgi:hypothetical protein